MANKNSSLRAAKSAKKDEFYTQLSDIEKELRHYKQHFRDKIVLCNCDDPFESNFFKYFVLNFNRLGLKKLIATCYVDSPIMGRQLQYCIDSNGQMSFSFGNEVQANEDKKPYKAVVTKVYDKTGNGGVDMLDIAELFKSGDNELSFLEGDGDFRSDECIELLKEADIVVTNPPFSLFREYVAQLMEYDKKFLVVGNKNSVTYKEIFSFIRENRMWIGMRSMNSDFWLYVPDGSAYEKVDENGNHLKHIMACWYTNLDIKKRHEEMILVKKYDSEKYPKYDNYDAININSTADIPCDYDGVMGVPITFMDKYNPEQFEIVDALNRYSLFDVQNTNEKVRLAHSHTCNINGKSTYFRIAIRNKHPEQAKGV